MSPDPADVLRRRLEQIEREKVGPAEKKLDEGLESAERAIRECRRSREHTDKFRVQKPR